MPELLKHILFIYPNWLIFLPLAIAIKNYKRYPAEFKYLTFYLALSAATQVMSFTLWQLGKNNYLILHFYTPLEYIILLLFYSRLLTGFISKTVLTILLIALPVFSVIDSCLLENIHTSNTYTRTLEALILIVLAINWYIKIVSETEEERWRQSGLNYINAGFLVYFSGAIMLFSYSSYIQQMGIESSLNLWTFHSFLAAQLYILITVGLWKMKTM